MESAVVVVSGYDPSYLKIFEHQVRTERAAGREVIVLDITPLEATPVDSYHRGVLRAFHIPYPGHDIAERMTGVGARYVRADTLLGHDDARPLEAQLEVSLEIAVESALITYYRTDRPDRSKRSVGRTARGLEREGRVVYRSIRSLIAAEPDLAVAYVPNGRFPHQKLATLAFADSEVPTKHVEKGEGPDRAYVQDYAPQDRLKSQASVDAVLGNLSAERIDEIADAWLARRAPARDSHNQFSTLWAEGLPAAIADAKRAGARLAGFFTSSQDEFQFLGPEWHLHTWEGQFEAFDQILTRLEGEGFTCYLRVHPNLATKAQDCFIRERNGVRWLAERHPDLLVIWHDDQANTYSLLEASDTVVVWYSTVGLEASARGLPVWSAAASRYGLIADTRELLTPSDLDSIGSGTWDVDSHRAKRFIAYLVERDQAIGDTAAWTSWNSSNPPLGVRLAAVPVSGGTPGVSAAILSLFDVYRHRRPSANLRYLGLRRS